MKIILLTHPDGSVGTRGGIGASFLARFEGDRDAALDHIINNLVPIQNPGATATIIEHTDLPPDRHFRDAWHAGGAGAAVDMPKAREIHKERLRGLRKPLLEALDIEVMKAVEGDDKVKLSELAAQKQALRDVTSDPGIDAAATPGELKAVLPDVLTRA